MKNRYYSYNNRILLTIKSFVLGILLLFSIETLHADNEKDSVINVNNYLIANWFRGVDKLPFRNSKWYKNTSFNVTVNPELMWDKSRYRKNIFNFSFGLTKDYTPNHSLYFVADFATRDKSDIYFRRVGGEVGYLWNLSNFYYGLDIHRMTSVIATTGLDFGYIEAENNYRKYYYGGYLGLRLSRAVSPHTSLFIEPRLGLYSNSFDSMSNEDGFDAMMTTHFGMNYKLSEMYYARKPRKPNALLHFQNWFFEIGGDVFLPVPKVDFVGNEETNYSDYINYGTTLGVGYRLNSIASARVKYTFADDRMQDVQQHITSLDLMLSGTNFFLGQSVRRYSDMAIILGPVLQIAKFEDQEKLHLSWGAEIGLQFTRRLNKNLELFAEPRIQVVQDYSKDSNFDLKQKKRWDMNLGLIYVYDKHLKLKHYDYRPWQYWYIQSLAGVQVSNLSSGDPMGSFDFSIGRNFGPIWGARATVFSGSLKSNESNIDDSWNPLYVNYFGGRFEMVTSLLRMFSPKLYNSRWNVSLSAGAEMGSLSNHYHNDVSWVAGTQVQFKATRNGWITAGARYEKPFNFEAKLPITANIGIQYDLNNEKRTDMLHNYWRWYIQGGAGYRNAFLNSDNLAYSGALGLNITPVHGIRFEYIGTKAEKDYDGYLYNWVSVSPEYVFNVSNKVFGEDDLRKVDFELFGGVDFMVHSTADIKETKIGFNLGAQANFNLNRSFAVYVEPRFSIQPFDDIIAPSGHERVHYHTLIGLRYTHNRFYAKDESRYRGIFDWGLFNTTKKIKNISFRNTHIGKWHPFKKK